MHDGKYRIQRFKENHNMLWDNFVMYNSANGTFLHSRRFLNYHESGKFIDCSVEVYAENELVAVCPACVVKKDQNKLFFSHKGSTFGGVVFGKKIYNAENVLEIIKLLDEYVSEMGFMGMYLRTTPDVFCQKSSALLEYALFYHGFECYKELNTYIDLSKGKEEIWKSFDRNKKRNIRKCEENNLWFRKLDKDEEIEQFYHLLKLNLSKFDCMPIHSLDELLEFKNNRIKDEVLFYGVGQQKKELLAAGMLFRFQQVHTLHAQNLSYDPYEKRIFSPITYLYYRIIMMAYDNKYSRLTWGISTENNGKDLNKGLIRNKESYGSQYFLNCTYYKYFE